MAEAGETTVLYLVRHGATDANLRRPYVLQGHAIDLPLSETGRRQAACVARVLAQVPLAAVYSSPMRRAVETAQVVAEAQQDVDTHSKSYTVFLLDKMVECDVGRWEGLSWEQIEKEYPDAFADFQRDPGRFPYLGGESYADVARRAVPVVESLLERHAGQSVALVAHNVVNRACLAQFMGIDLARAKDIQQGNGGVNVIRRRGDRIEVVTLNSLFHLDEDLR
jgi:broad specificity phosphatase PhoE